MSTNSNAPAGWYPVDGGQRYWNGAQWTADFRPDPVPAAAAVTGSRQPHAFSSPESARPAKAAQPGASYEASAIGKPAAKSQGSAAAVPGGPTGGPKTKAAWYRRGWVIGLAALVVGIGIGGASAGGTPDPKTSQAYKDLSSQLEQSRQQTADAKSQLQSVQGDLPGREAALKKAETQVKRDQSAVAAREKSVAKREKAVGIVEKTVAANTVSGTGMFKVGVDMKAGTYKTAGRSGCYYAVLNSSDTNDIATNNLSDGPGFVTVSVGQYFESQDCADFILQQ